MRGALQPIIDGNVPGFHLCRQAFMLQVIIVTGVAASLTHASLNIQENLGGLLMNNTLAKAEFGHPRLIMVLNTCLSASTFPGE